jgi:hypothetical protein
MLAGRAEFGSLIDFVLPELPLMEIADVDVPEFLEVSEKQWPFRVMLISDGTDVVWRCRVVAPSRLRKCAHVAAVFSFAILPHTDQSTESTETIDALFLQLQTDFAEKFIMGRAGVSQKTVDILKSRGADIPFVFYSTLAYLYAQRAHAGLDACVHSGLCRPLSRQSRIPSLRFLHLWPILTSSDNF